MTLVTFNADIYPYCKGDVVNLTAKELSAVDKVAKGRSIEKPYVKASGKVASQASDEGEDSAES